MIIIRLYIFRTINDDSGKNWKWKDFFIVGTPRRDSENKRKHRMDQVIITKREKEK